MLKKIGLVIVVGIASVLAFAATKPNTMHIERQATIKAQPAEIAGLIEDFRSWRQWSPWDKLDPAMKTTYSGSDKGVGAIYEWQGNDKVGAGRMEILESTPDQVKIKLDFLKPFEAHNLTTFTLREVAGGTQVTWAMDGPQPLMSKVMSLFMDMDKMIGSDFEKGLAALKGLAENS